MYKFKLTLALIAFSFGFGIHAATITDEQGITYVVKTEPTDNLPGTCVVGNNRLYAQSTTIKIPAVVTDGDLTYNVIGVAKEAFGGRSSSNPPNQTIEIVDFSQNPNLTYIDEDAFYGCPALKSVDFSGCVQLQTIGDWAFYGCPALKSVDFSECVQLQTLEDYSFCECTALEEINLSGCIELQKIGFASFYQCAAKKIDLSECINLREIGYDTIETGAYGTFSVCPNLETIDFSGCSKLEYIGSYTFTLSTNLKYVIFPTDSQLKILGRGAFYGCSGLTELDFSNCTKLQSIRSYCFRGCTGLTELDFFPCNQLQSLEDASFVSCSSLESLILPASLQSIDQSSLSNCTSLQTITCYATVPPVVGDNVFFYTQMKNSGTLYVPAKSVETYRRDKNWGIAKNILPIVGVPVTGITLTPSSQELLVGESATFTAEITPDNATYKDIWWRLNNTFASIEQNDGFTVTVKAWYPGTTTLLATAEGGDNISTSATITIKDIPKPTVVISKSSVTLLEGQQYTLTAEVTPPKEDDNTITWTSDNQSTVKVENGTLTAIKAGRTIIHATSGEISAECIVVVLNNDEWTMEGSSSENDGGDKTPAENTEQGAYFDGTNLWLRINQTGIITFDTSAELTVTPEFEWNVNDPSIATMSSQNTQPSMSFTGKSRGETTWSVKIKGADSPLASGKIIVIAEKPITSIKFDPEDIIMALNTLPLTVTATLTPSDATVPNLKWEVTNGTEFITMGQDKNNLSATITPKQAGSATVTVTAQDGSKTSSSFTVTVKELTSGEVEIESGDGSQEGDFTDDPVKDTQNGAIIKGNDILMRVGQTAKLKLTAEGVDALPDFEWSVAESAIASVSPGTPTIEATFTGVAVGETTWSVKAKGSEITLAEGKITVIAEKPISSIRLDVEDITMALNTLPFTVTATLTPSDATVPILKWEVTNGTEFITMGQDKNNLSATITPKQAGSATVTVTAQDGSKTTTSFTVTVKEVSSGDVKIEPGDGWGEGSGEGGFTDDPVKDTGNGAVMRGNDILMRVGQTAKLKLTAEGIDVMPELVWTVVETSIASVSPDASTLEATFTGVAVGETTWEVKAKGNETILATGKIIVIAERPITGITLYPTEINMALNAMPQTITATIAPEDASMPVLNWTSSDDKVATVDENGKVTPVAKGQAVITAAATDGSLRKATCNVTVSDAIADDFEFDFPADNGDADIDANNVILRVGDTYTAVIKPKTPEAVLPKFTWTSSSGAVASVDNDGKVTALSVGTSTVTAAAIVNDKTLSLSFNITVIPALSTDFDFDMSDVTDGSLEGVEFDANGLNLEVGYEYTLSPKANDENELPELSWTSSDEAVAEVDENGTVTGISPGTAYISASATVKGEKVEALVTVNVVPATVKTLSLHIKSATIDLNEPEIVLYVTHGPTHADIPQLTWSSSDENIVTVAHNGTMQANVTPHKTGLATIRVCLANNADIYDDCEVVVTDSTNGINNIFNDNNERAEVFDLQGHHVLVNVLINEYVLQDLQPGVYIIVIGGKTYKIVRP